MPSFVDLSRLPSHIFGVLAVLATLVASAALIWLESTMVPTVDAEFSRQLMIQDTEQRHDERQILQLAQRYWREDEPAEIALDAQHFWWVARVANRTEPTAWVVEITNSSIERAEMYVFHGDKPKEHTRVDLLEQARSDQVDLTIGHMLPFELPPGESRTLVLRLATPIAHNSLIVPRPAAEAVASNARLLRSIWLFAGAILGLVLYNLFIAARLHDLNYLLYVGHASGHLIFLLTGVTLLGSSLDLFPRYFLLNMPGLGMGELFGALFVYRFLELRRVAPRMATAFRIYIGWLLAAPLVYLLVGFYNYLELLRISHLLLAFLVIPAAVVAMRAGVNQARYILFGWGILLAFTLKGMLGVLDLVPLHISAAVWAFAAVLFEMFVLSLALADRVRQLQFEKTAAEESNEAKGVFLATMSHEIRTPLNGILSMVELLRSTTMGKRQREYVETIHSSGSSLLAILNDILDYSRVASGQLSLELTEFSPRELTRRACALMGASAEEKGLQFTCQVSDEVPSRLCGDPVRLQQIVLNLLGNAIKFTQQGRVELTLDWHVDALAPPCLRLCVSDSGIGIDAEQLPNLFDRFSQGDSSINRRFGGTGLGLAISNELAVAMGGVLEVQSERGKGSRFTLRLPLEVVDGEPAAPIVTSPRHRAASMQPLDLLLVDDDLINRFAAAELLKQAGHRVEAVDCGMAALEAVGERHYDAVLLDVSMPDLDGREVTRRLRARGETLPIIGLTANALPEQDASCLEAGMDGVHHKPINITELRRHLSELIGKR